MYDHTTIGRVDIYGQPDHGAMDELQAFASPGVPLNVVPHTAGFNHLQESDQCQYGILVHFFLQGMLVTEKQADTL